LLDTGDIGAARVVLERAAAAGSAIAALRLGETYDPVILRRSGTQANTGDEAQAQRWYEQAERLGSPRAAERLSDLRKR
jgi:TPR repeat protein